eukprot:6643003-Lingulodinium_polyedra.AAC.1
MAHARIAPRPTGRPKRALEVASQNLAPRKPALRAPGTAPGRNNGGVVTRGRHAGMAQVAGMSPMPGPRLPTD